MAAAIAGQVDRYLVIDGYQRIAALQQLGRDTGHGGRRGLGDERGRSSGAGPFAALGRTRDGAGSGWLRAELEQRFGYGLDELARRFDRSLSWVSRRLALVDQLPESVQQKVRNGAAHGPRGDEVPGAGSTRGAWKTVSAWPKGLRRIGSPAARPASCTPPGEALRLRSGSAFSINRSCF